MDYNKLASNPYYRDIGISDNTLSNIEGLVRSIESNEYKFEKKIDSSEYRLGIQFDHDKNKLESLSKKLKGLLKEREERLSELDIKLKANNLIARAHENEALIRYSRSRIILAKHRNAVNYLDLMKKQNDQRDSIVCQMRDVIGMMKIMYNKKRFEKAVQEIPELQEYVETHNINGNLSQMELREVGRILVKHQLHHMDSKSQTIYDKAQDMAASSQSNLHYEKAQMMTENIMDIARLTNEFRSVNLDTLDKRSYTAIMGNLNQRKVMYNNTVAAINNFQKKSGDMLYVVPPHITGGLVRFRPLLEEDHKNFREWAKKAVKGVLPMKTVDESLKWGLRNVRYLDDDLKYIQDQMKEFC